MSFSDIHRNEFCHCVCSCLSVAEERYCSPCTASYSVQGQVLQNHTIKAETAERIGDCMMRCIAYPGCHSSNFYRLDKRCELNDKTHASHPEDMGYKPYTIYTENIFRPMPCRDMLDCGRQMICSSSLICEGYALSKRYVTI